MERLYSSHSNMWGEKYGKFYFAGNLGISLQKLYMKFVFEPNFDNFEYWKSELGWDWLLQYFHHCNWHNSLLYHICYQFSFFHHIPHSSLFIFWKCYTCTMDMKICKHVIDLLRYHKINSDRYSYMRTNRDISPQTTIFLVFGGPKYKFSKLWT